ncbi:MoaD/ThiS family protein [Paramagnetospirillum magnetotacticum]|nr:MoaD/ThiS family protein [Paramagnetospirillum magnetotacticum]
MTARLNTCISSPGIGDNSGLAPTISVTVKLFNSLSPYAGGSAPLRLDVPAGTVIGELAARFHVPRDKIFLVLVNGKDVTRQLGAPVNLDRELDDGDEVALSGPVPYSWGYGAPIV